ncbi:MAG: DUF3015 domain-containing protein [Gammaproteobacteria bacterium]|nr:DUF3015 domain-containing protein [Gammaproteobacteria bacterium]MCW8922604.1 DUF3015 domain-containing protein [Gammaproteobacteria bacterium]
MIKNNFKNITGAFVVGMLLAAVGCTTTDVTSSTSSSVDAATPDVTLNRFVDVRITSIKKEAAAGEGENLEALAQLMGKQDKQAFSGWMQVNYDALFNNLEQPEELISRIEMVTAQTQKI